ncbi:hypothetical protein T07_5743 [Trichinella nelsoni]|uniref:Uncharacterized protein n=1 Tax=Trichinella nelsoni TaxID=6336 RepID=A0A0V0S5D2_9BILA|nr:hypothetical protein T07_5743 [Trichinella nelsoni]
MCFAFEPLPRAGTFTSSNVLLARSSLFGDGPVLTGGFPFLSDSRFPDGIVAIKQKVVRIFFIGNREREPTTMCYRKLLRQHNDDSHTYVRTTVLHLRSSSPILLTVASPFFCFVVWRTRVVRLVRVRNKFSMEM